MSAKLNMEVVPMKYLNKAGLFIILIIGITSMFGSQNSTVRNTPEPRFTSFSVNPLSVCLNIGIPLVQISYEFDPDGWINENTLCTNVLANGEYIHQTIRHQCLDDGTSGSLTFNLADQFGTNTPSEIVIRVELVPLVAGVEHDSRERAISTSINCTQPGML